MGPASPTAADLAWFKSSYSGGNETECVEAAPTAGGAAIRDSKRPLDALLTFGHDSWSDFLAAVRHEQLG